MIIKKLALEYIMGLSFFASGVAATYYQTTRDPAQMILSIAFNVAGYVLCRSLENRAKNEKTNV